MSIECRSIKKVTSKDIKFEENIVESRVVTNMNEIKLSKDNKCILEKDEMFIKEIEELFDYKDKKNLIPHCFWGNIKDPEIVILAKNPSYSIDDELDNKYFRKTFMGNLKIEDRDESIINVLFSSTSYDGIPFELSCVSKWWRAFFDKNINLSNQETFMSKICILNLCGYYKTTVEKKIGKHLFWFYDNKNNKIDDVIIDLFNKEKNKNLKKVISVWKFNDNNPWKDILLKLGIQEVKEAEKRNRFTPYLKLLKDY